MSKKVELYIQENLFKFKGKGGLIAMIQAYADQEVEELKKGIIEEIGNYSGNKHIPINLSKGEQTAFVFGLIRGGLIAKEIIEKTKI